MSEKTKYREVEQKYPILNGSQVRQKLIAMGAQQKGSPRIQEDRYFTPAHKNYLEPAIVSEWLRVRIEPKGSSINYKCWQPIGAEVATHCDEYETRVENHEALLKLLEALGCKPIVTVKKQRDIFVLDEFEISFDHIDELGDFIEVEAKSDSEDIEQIHSRINDLLKNIGAQLHRGYPYLLLHRQH